MEKTRRELFQLGASTALAWCLPTGSRAEEPPVLRVAESAREAFLAADPLLTRSVLGGQLGTAFAVQGQGGRRQPALTLTGVADLPSAGVTGLEGNDLCFSALFTGGKADAPLAQRTYELAHRELGTVSVFLVPMGRHEDGVRYEAVFNRAEA